jgi:hypothetical protein
LVITTRQLGRLYRAERKRDEDIKTALWAALANKVAKA